MTRAEVIAAVLAEHTRNGPVEEPGGGLPHSHWRTKCDGESCDFYAEGGYWDLVRQHTAHVAAALDAALAAQEGERGGAEVAAVEAERWEEGHTQGVIDYMNRHEPGLTPNDRLLRAVMLVDAWQANPYRADRIEAQP